MIRAAWVGLLLLSPSFARAQEAKIRGQISEVADAKIQIVTEGDALPNVGDAVQVCESARGLVQGIIVAEGKVTEVKDDLVSAALEKGAEKARKGQFVSILSDKPRSRPGWKAGVSPVRLAAADWEPSLNKDGSACEFKPDGAATLSVPAEKGTGAYAISRKPFLGDFDVSVRVDLLEWKPMGGVPWQAALMAARPEESYRRQAYVIERNAFVREKDKIQDTVQPWTIQEGRTKVLSGRSVDTGARPFRLRLTRRAGVITAFYDAEAASAKGEPNRAPRWVESARFEVPCGEPLHLMLGVANSPSDKESKEHPAVRARFSELTLRP